MANKPNTRNWKDMQTVIASVAIVTTLGMWELVAAPAKAEAIKTLEPAVPPTEPPAAAAEPKTEMPNVKIMFTPAVSINNTTVVPQSQGIQKKKKNHSGGGGSVTRTHSS
jgi:hypothetical protein